MSTQDLVPSPVGPVDVEQAEAALVERYPRLVRIAYLVLPPSLGRNRRVLTAHALVQRSLPRRRVTGPAVPRPRPAEDAVDPGYAYVRGEVLRQALVAGLPLRRLALPRRAQLPPLLPHVWGLRLFPRVGGADELALDQRLSRLSGPGRAAYVLRGLERQGDAEVLRVLAAAGVADPGAALAEADALDDREDGTAGAAPEGPDDGGDRSGGPAGDEAGSGDGPAGTGGGEPGGGSGAGRAAGRRSGVALLESDEFDPCALQARPTDLLRRRQHARAGVVAVAALLVCGALLGLPGDGWGRNGAAAPSYARNPAAEAALDPARLKRVDPAVWPGSTRQDFSVWPARGALVGDRALLRRALAVWARPGASVRSSATPGTPVGPPMGPPQLLFAGVVDGARVVLLHDGLRAVRYAEPVAGTAGAALDFARTDGADGVGSAALVLSRAAGNVRYLTAPWVAETSARNLLAPGEAARPLGRDAGGVTEPMTSPASARDCTRWNTLQVRDGSGLRLLADLGELAPARLLWGPPEAPADATGPEARAAWARTACQLTAVRAHGVRSVNAWRFARQPLPEGAGLGTWLCTRAETWRGTGSRVLAQFLVPSPAVPAALAARSEGSPACGVRDPRVLAGVLWQAPAGGWYVLAAGSPDFAALETSGGVKGRSDGPLLAVKAAAGARADLGGTLRDGTRARALR
ncbi:hypothetical protein ACF064_15175 [Streptomyces sp. NPDC015492]|uniref:hypothetical protein n=1 Tax=Streptomyces sp. NPDC015492 TaxID=3364958 RepID=UPI0036FDE79B